MSDVTRLLDTAAAGDRQAAAELLPLVYDELRRLAAARMAAEAPGHTLDSLHGTTDGTGEAGYMGTIQFGRRRIMNGGAIFMDAFVDGRP